MSKLYDRADIYDLIDSDQRTDAIRRDWKEFLDKREIHTSFTSLVWLSR